ncbi:MAG: hypothetical protein A2Z69_00195 [Bacteroidetes bacterium RBG_13_44_24]|nr:MAG: hypothetical protein A2Z69_00195 [Bacteroidetes bacterium RBG_13_44_24]
MKKILLILAMVMLVPSICLSADLALKMTWLPNTDSVTTGYKIYRVDGVRTFIATIPGKTTVQYLFNVMVSDGSSGTLKFLMTATSATKESADSVVVSYPFDLIPIPTVPVGVGISQQ